MTFAIGDTQYIAINAGWNSAIVAGLDERSPSPSRGPARLLVFALDAKGVTLPPAPPRQRSHRPRPTNSPARRCSPAVRSTRRCAGPATAPTPRAASEDLRYLTPEQHAGFMDTVLKGTHKSKGMASFRDLLTEEQAAAIHSYLINRAQEDWQPMIGPSPKQR